VVPELENLVGLFVNTLALRAHLSPVAATADTARVARRLPVRSCVAFALVAGIRPRDSAPPRACVTYVPTCCRHQRRGSWLGSVPDWTRPTGRWIIETIRSNG
jgi:hypothetical protein